MLISKGSRGPWVKAIQELLLSIDPLCLPKFGVDGDYGGECIGAVDRLLGAGGSLLDHDDQQHLLDLRPQGVLLPSKYVDNRKTANVLQRKNLRSVKDVNEIVWHQTDVPMGERASRYVDSSAHFFVTAGGQIIQLHDIEWLTYHAHALNTCSIGIEIEGAFLGIEGDPKTWASYHTKVGRKPSILTQAAIDAACRLARYIRDLLLIRGGELKRYYTHRQGSDMRDRDPGSAIYQLIVLVSALELSIDVPFLEVRGKGKPVPKEWDSRSDKRY